MAVWDASNPESALRQQLEQVHNGISWCFTRPLRAGNRKLVEMKRLLKRIVAVFLERLLHWLSKKPQLKDACLRWAQRFPMLRGRLAAFARAQGYGVPTLDFLDGDEEGQWYIDAPKGAVTRWNAQLQGISKSK